MRSKFLVLLLLPLASAASAKDFQFGYQSAELVSPQGLYERLDRAVAKHCGEINDIRNLRVLRACEIAVMQNAVEQIDHPQLSAYVESSRKVDRS